MRNRKWAERAAVSDVCSFEELCSEDCRVPQLSVAMSLVKK